MNGNEYYQDKVILITGGVGSIGSQLVRKLLTFNPKSLIILDNNETGLFDLHQELNSNKVQILIGDVRDRERLEMVFTGVDVIFHAAALKHVPLCEYNPYEGVKTNIIGTQNVLDAAIQNQVEKVIMISTDKAVNPINTMGASKYIAERLTIAANNHQKNVKTIFSVVRFGNVLNSRGSIIPIFMHQLGNKLPLTVTDPDMTRFVMTIQDAADLVIKAAILAKGMEVFILKMPVLKIIDLAKIMREYFASRFDYNSDEIPINIIGKRVGEKLYEELMTVEESAFAYENDHMFIVYPPHVYDVKKSHDFSPPEGCSPVTMTMYSSLTARCIGDEEIYDYLNKLDV